MGLADLGNDTIWIFSNSRDESIQISVQGLESAKALVSLLRIDELEYWLAINSENNKQQPVSQYPALFEKHKLNKKSSPVQAREATSTSKSTLHPSVTVLGQEIFEKKRGIYKAPEENPESTHTNLKEADRRAYKRIPFRIDVILIKGKEVFKACTKDISMGGIKLDSTVPDIFLDEFCRVIICNTNHALLLELQGKILESSKKGSRVLLRMLNHQNFCAWQELIDSLDTEKKLKVA